MLTEETIENLIDCRLPDDEIRRLLIEVNERIDLRIFSAFIKSVKAKCAYQFTGTLDAIDCSGTGGSGLPHFNTSTTVAFILAAGGVNVAKFGNRAASSLTGSFDLLDALGIPATLSFDRVRDCLESCGVVFLYAPHYYPDLARLAAIRRSLPGPSIFNAIGPLLHPLNPRRRLMGTSNEVVYKLVADYLAQDKNTESAIVVRSRRGLDEFDPCAITDYIQIGGKQILNGAERTITGAERTLTGVERTLTGVREPVAGIQDCKKQMTPEYSFEIFKRLIGGGGEPYFSELVCQNAGAAFFVAGKADTIDDGAALAHELLESQAVAQKYKECRRTYAQLAS